MNKLERSPMEPLDASEIPTEELDLPRFDLTETRRMAEPATRKLGELGTRNGPNIDTVHRQIEGRNKRAWASASIAKRGILAGLQRQGRVAARGQAARTV